MRSRIRAADLFSGLGGSSFGATKAGAKIVAAVDIWDLARESFLDNFQHVKFYNQKCEDVNLQRFHKEVGRIDLLLASPECTSHTCAKGNAARSEVSRRTAFQVVRFARKLKPRWIVVENVVHMRRWRRYKKWLTALEDMGYHCRVQVLNAADFGAPQARRRLFVTCDRLATPSEIKPTRSKQVSVKRIISGRSHFRFSPLRTKKRAKATLKRAESAIRKSRGKAFILVYYGSDASGGWQRLSRPLRTITTVDRFALVRKAESGVYEMRMLQVPELQRAMGFPASFRLRCGTRRDRIRLLGNAVCPPVMEAVVKNLTNREFESKQGVNGSLR